MTADPMRAGGINHSFERKVMSSGKKNGFQAALKYRNSRIYRAEKVELILFPTSK